MTQETIYAIIGAVIILAGITIGLYILKKFSEKLNIFIRDTLKERQADGYWKWSKTSLTMASAWYSVLFAFLFTTIKKGEINMEMFAIMVSVAVGIPVTNAFAKKMNPLTKIEKDDNKQE